MKNRSKTCKGSLTNHQIYVKIEGFDFIVNLLTGCRIAAEWELRAGAAAIGTAGHAGNRARLDPAMADGGLRGVHPVGAEAGGHAAGGAGGFLRRPPRQRRLHQAAGPPHQGRPLLPHLQRRPHLRPGGAPQRLCLPRVRRTPHADHVQQQRLGLLLLGLPGQVRRHRPRHPQSRRLRGPSLRPPHRLRRHSPALPAPQNQQ